MKVNSKTKDSVFKRLFSEKEYALELYKVFHPEDKNATQEDLQFVTIENLFVNDYYNDIGLLIKNRLIILIEAQSTWNPNMALRTFIYLAETYKNYIHDYEIDLFSPGIVKVPEPEIIVIFTGERKGRPETQKLSANFITENKLHFPLELTVKMVYDSSDSDIVFQYITFCKVFDAQSRIHKNDKKKAIIETLKICKDQKLLENFLKKHEQEVFNMMTMWGFDDEWLRMVHEKNMRKIIADGEEEIKRNKAEIAQTKAELKQNKAEISALYERIAELEAMLTEVAGRN